MSDNSSSTQTQNREERKEYDKKRKDSLRARTSDGTRQ
jgi:hypothetical protein